MREGAKEDAGKNKQRYSVWSNALFILQGMGEFDRYLLGFIIVNAVFSALGQFVPILMPKYVVDELTGRGSAQGVIKDFRRLHE